MSRKTQSENLSAQAERICLDNIAETDNKCTEIDPLKVLRDRK